MGLYGLSIRKTAVSLAFFFLYQSHFRSKRLLVHYRVHWECIAAFVITRCAMIAQQSVHGFRLNNRKPPFRACRAYIYIQCIYVCRSWLAERALDSRLHDYERMIRKAPYPAFTSRPGVGLRLVYELDTFQCESNFSN